MLKSFDLKKTQKIREIEVDFKSEFKQNNPLTKTTLCCLCDFPIEPRATNGWAYHFFKAEYLFLENIFTQKEMTSMGIDKFDYFSKKLNKILDMVTLFCTSIENESMSSNSDIYEIAKKIKKIKTSTDDDKKVAKEKTIGFLYSQSINFLPWDKVKGDFLISDKF